MSRSRRVISLAVLAVAIGMVVPATVPTAAQSSYEISVSDAIDVPDRTVTVDGDEFTITRVSQVRKGDAIDAHITAPDERYDVYLYNHDSQEEFIETRSGDSQVSFPTDELAPGSYFVAVVQSDYEAIYPVVVEGYAVDLDAPSSVERGETVEVSIPVTATGSNGDPPAVQLVVGDELRRIDATNADGTYTASISTDDFAAGDYPIYGVVRGEEETDDGRSVILGLSDRRTLTVTEPTPTETDDSGSSDSSGSTGGSSGGSSAGTSNATPTPTSTASPTPSPTPTATADETESPTASPTARATETTGTPTESPTPTDDDVITPASPARTEPTPSGSPTPTAGQPGFGVVTAVLAAVSLLVIRRR